MDVQKDGSMAATTAEKMDSRKVALKALSKAEMLAKLMGVLLVDVKEE